MKKLTLISVVFMLMFTIGFMDCVGQSILISTENLEFESSNSVTFDCYIKNNGGSNWTYSKGQYSWDYNSAVLNGGTVTFTIIPGTTELGGSVPPSTATGTGIIRTTSNLDGAGPVLTPEQKLRVAKFRLRTSASSFASLDHNIIFRKSTTPYTRVYWWNGSTGTEFTGANKSYIELPNVPLPVQLAGFSASIENKRDVKLTWKTTQEINNSGFDIERKTQEGLWSKIGYIQGKGTTSEVTTYNFEDRRLNTGKYNYRLKQIDNNGNFEYHELSGYVEVGVPTKYDLSQNYPNPFNPVTKIDYDIPYDGFVKIVLYDITGREVANLVNEQHKAGYYTVQFNAVKLSSGTYFYRMIANGSGNDNVFTKKMVVIK